MSDLDKNTLNRKALISGVFFVATQLVVRGISFIVTPIYTRLVSTAQYGEIRVYESWLLILVPIFSLSLYRSVERAKYDFEDDFDGYCSAAQTLSYVSITGFLLVISLFFRDAFMKFCEMNGFMYVFMACYVFAYTSTMFYQKKEKQMLRYRQATKITGWTMIPAMLLSIVLLYWAGKNGYQDQLVEVRIAGFYAPQIVGGLLVAFLIWQSGRATVNLKYWKYALAYSLPLIPELLSIQVMNQSDKIMIKKLTGGYETGIFSLATTVSFIIWIVEDAVWYAWLPWLYEKLDRGEKEDAKRPWTYLMALFGYISWCLVMVAPELILILGGSKYDEAKYLVAPMLCGVLFKFFSYSYTAIENFYKKTTYVAIGTTSVMVVNVVLNYVCIQRFGYQAAAYTTAASYFLLIIIQGLLEKKVTGQWLMPLSKMVLAAGVIFVINLLSVYTYRFPWFVRYAILLASAAAALKLLLPFSKELIKQLKRK